MPPVAPPAHRRPLLLLPLAVASLLLSASAGAQQRQEIAHPATLNEKEEEHLNSGLGEPPADLDRSTPYRSWSALLAGCQARRFEAAMHVLNLGDVPEGEQKTLGAALTRQLCEVLATAGPLSAAGVNDSTMGPLAEDKPRNYLVAASLKTPSGVGEVWLRKVNDKKSGAQLWVITRKTVSQIQVWYTQLVKKQKVARREVDVVNRGLGKLPDPIKASSPREATEQFLALSRQGSYADAARLLDLSGLPEKQQAKQGPQLARRLNLVLKRVHPGSFGRLSNDPAGAPETGVPLDEEVVARTRQGDQEAQIRLARFHRTGADAVWVFSDATVAEVPALYSQLGYGWAGDYLPPLFFEVELLGIQLWQWLGLLGLLVPGFLFGVVASLALRKLLLRLAAFTRWEWDDELVAAMSGPLRLTFWVLGYLAGLPFLALADRPDEFVHSLGKLVMILALGWFVVRIIEMVGQMLLRFFGQRGDDIGLSMVPVARKVLKAVVVAIVAIFALQNMGMDVGSLLAGLGIGGLAFALASKSLLENLLGGITIAFDRPFKVGDLITVSGITGTVEDLGLRSTRIRTADRSIVTIPNGQMVDSKIENFAHRDRVRLLTTLGLQYDTSQDQLLFVIDEFKRFLLAHPRVYTDGWRVRFAGYSASSLDIEVLCYLTTSDFAEFTALREEVLLGLGEIVRRAGAEFAFPSQTVYVGKDSQADGKKARQAAQTVAARREQGELCVPEIPEVVRRKLERR